MKRVFALVAFLSIAGLPVLAAEPTGETPAEPPKESPKETPQPAPKAETPVRPRRPEGRRPGGDALRVIAAFFRERDSDNDAKLSKKEFDNDKLFEELDEDKDGFLTMAECAKHTDKIREEAARRQKLALEAEFKALDRNDDKKLTADELGDRKALLEKGDKNDDKALDLEEYAAARQAQRADEAREAIERARDTANKTVEEAFKELDKNGDGKISGDELTDRVKVAMERTGADADKDGALTLEEFKVLRDKMAEGMRERRPRERRPEGEERPRERRPEGEGRPRRRPDNPQPNPPPKKDPQEEDF